MGVFGHSLVLEQGCLKQDIPPEPGKSPGQGEQAVRQTLVLTTNAEAGVILQEFTLTAKVLQRMGPLLLQQLSHFHGSSYRRQSRVIVEGLNHPVNGVWKQPDIGIQATNDVSIRPVNASVQRPGLAFKGQREIV